MRSARPLVAVFWFPAVLILFGLNLYHALGDRSAVQQFEPLNKQHPDLVASIR